MPDVVSLVALSLTCFHGCVKGLIVISKAKHYNRDVLDVRLQIELTLHSLTTWAGEARLLQEPPTLLMSANNAVLVPQILGQLETLLLDLNQLKQRYGLYLQPTSEDVEALYDELGLELQPRINNSYGSRIAITEAPPLYLLVPSLVPSRIPSRIPSLDPSRIPSLDPSPSHYAPRSVALMDLGGVSFLRLYKRPYGLYNTSRVNDNYNLS
jgi:hypothetical protein